MYNVFDYMNVQNIHNATFREIVSENGTSDYIMVSGWSCFNSLGSILTSNYSLPLMQRNSRYLANYHEQALFTDPDVDGIGNIAAHTMIPPIIDALEKISNSSSELKLQYIGVAYKPVSKHICCDTQKDHR